MKYLKTYELTVREWQKKLFSPGYSQGDYVIFFIPYDKWHKKLELKGKIKTITIDTVFPYRIVDINGKEDTFQLPNIIRKMTPEEIDEYEMKIQGNKYNI